MRGPLAKPQDSSDAGSVGSESCGFLRSWSRNRDSRTLALPGLSRWAPKPDKNDLVSIFRLRYSPASEAPWPKTRMLGYIHGRNGMPRVANNPNLRQNVEIRRRARNLCAILFAAFAVVISGCGGFSAASYNAEGVRLYEQARFDDAMRQFQEASFSEPMNADAYYNLAATYHRLGKTYNSTADLDKAETYYNMCLDRNENHTDCYRGLAVLLAEEGRSAEAFRLLQGWAGRQPSSSDARIEIARLYEEYGDRNSAKEQLIEALAAQPNNARALAALGHIREQSGDTVQALANYERAVSYGNQQPQLVARAAALRSATGAGYYGTPLYGPTLPANSNGGTMMADRNTAPIR